MEVNYHSLGEDSLFQAPGLKSPASSNLSRCPTTMANSFPCSVADCEYVARTEVPEDMDPTLKVRMLELQMMELQVHASSVHHEGRAAARSPGVKAKKEAPKLQLGVDQQAWDQFMTRWSIYKTTMGIDGSAALSWLFACLDRDLGDEVIKANPGTEPQNMTEAAPTASIKKLAVKVGSKLLHRIKMGQLKQDPGVSVNNYLAAL